MNSAVINIKVPPKIKKQAQTVAEHLGLTLSAILNGYLRTLIRTRSVEFSDVRLELTPWAKRMLERSEKDIKAGRATSFTPDEMLAHLDTMITDEENTRSR